MVIFAIDKLTSTEVNPRFAASLKVVAFNVVAFRLAGLGANKPILRLPATVSVPVTRHIEDIVVVSFFQSHSLTFPPYPAACGETRLIAI
jgi:hypothetical protein